MASNLRVDTILPSTGTTLGIGTANGTINFLGNSNINTTGVVTATSFSGGLPITNGANNRVITASSASALNGEANLTFETSTSGGTLTVAGTSEYQIKLKDTNSSGNAAETALAFTDSGDTIQGFIGFNYWGDGNLDIQNSNSGGSVCINTGGGNERMTIASDGNVHINCPDNGTANAKVNIEESTNNTTNTLKLINKPSGANGKARLEFYTETSSGQGCSPYIMSTSGTDAFGSNSANDGGLQFHSKHGGSGTDVNALEISNKGYVLQPARPYFKANLSSGTRITNTGYVTFNSAVHNNGSHYNTGNGRFTAPIAGLYWFSARINAYDRIDFQIRVNGSDVERGQYNTDSDNVGWWSNQLTTIVEMTAGQYAQVYVSNLDQQSDPGDWCTFMGYLVG